MCGFLIKSAWRYVKISAHLLQFLCHMTSDVKFSQVFFFFSYLHCCSKALRSKRTLALEQVSIFSEAVVHRFSQKACNFIKKILQHRREFCEIFKNTFFTEPLRWLRLFSLEHKSKNDKIYLHKYIHRKTPMMTSFFLAQFQTWEHIVLRQRHSLLDVFMKFVKFYRISFVQ